jgi:DNA-binding transcriptional regulator WhiA
MQDGLSKKYLQKGWNKDKEIKYRTNETFEKDLTVEKEVSKKVDKKRKNTYYNFEVCYNFHEIRFGDHANFKIDYKYIYFQARDKEEAKELFEIWNKERLEVLTENWIKDHPIKENKINHWFGNGVIHSPEYFIKINDIKKVSK